MHTFVQIASYRDPQLIPTIEHMLRKAAYPQHLRIGVCRQYHPGDHFDDLTRYKNDSRFRILDVPHSQSGGVCWARSLVQRLYGGEEYTLQIDSHMRFADLWDQHLIGMVRTLQSIGYPKPLLTGYVPSFEPHRAFRGDPGEPPLRMVFNRFSPEGIALFKADTIPGWQQLTAPVRGRFFSAGFCFTLGTFCSEVPYDPELYFYGEEISMTVRAFTSGYDLFHPHRTILWHYYGRHGMRRHWDDHKDWHLRDEKSLKKTMRLLGVDADKTASSAGKYGLGTVRTLKDYERYAGIVFAQKVALR